MRDRGLDPDFSQAELAEAAALKAAPTTTDEPVRDLRSLLWCSIDNDDSRDLDQLSVAESLPGGDVKVLVAIADVDVAGGQRLADRSARRRQHDVGLHAGRDLSDAARAAVDRSHVARRPARIGLSVVIEFIVAPDGALERTGRVRRARTQPAEARLQQRRRVAGRHAAPLPAAAAAVPGMDVQLKLQDGVAQALEPPAPRARARSSSRRSRRGRTSTATRCAICTAEVPNRAKALIENLMVAANGVTARFLDAHGFPSIRRVVKEPERWDRIVAVGDRGRRSLPATPDSQGARRVPRSPEGRGDPTAFADLSQTIIKLLGSGRVRRRSAGRRPARPFRPRGEGLHALDGAESALSRSADAAARQGGAGRTRKSRTRVDELERLAAHCTQQEDAANKVERQVRKSAAALLVASARRPDVRRDRHRRVAQGHVRARGVAADRRHARQRRTRRRRRRSRPRAADARRRRARLHRFQRLNHEGHKAIPNLKTRDTESQSDGTVSCFSDSAFL